MNQSTLNKYIADCGVCSRRKAVELIKEGQILVNAVVVTEPGYRVQQNDSVKFEGRLIKPTQRKLYIVINKPRGYVTSLDDPYNDKSVTDLVKPAIKERVFPVGRLDVETSGLLLLTNDGQFAERLAHPRYEVRKRYAVVLDRPLEESDMQRLRNGITLRDGFIKPDDVYPLTKKGRTTIAVELHSGKYHIIRRMFGHLGYHVSHLDRFGYAGISKFKLDPGCWRFLTHDEMVSLSKYYKKTFHRQVKAQTDGEVKLDQQ